MRMLWKPNKGVQISEVEDDMFLEEFGDERDKRRVLDMCPWSYKKQLIVIQDYEGEMVLKDIDLRWPPFWIQFFYLPLKSRTM